MPLPQPVADDELAGVLAGQRVAARPREHHLRRLRRVALVCAVLVLGLSISVVAGWITGEQSLVRLLPGQTSMKMTTATAMTGLAASTTFLSVRVPPARWQITAIHVLTVVVGLMAMAALVQDGTGTDWGIDNLFGLDTGTGSGFTTPGRMAPSSAMVVVLLALALLALIHDRVSVGQLFALAAFTIGTLSMLGYLFGVEDLYTLVVLSSMSLHAAVTAVLLGIGVLCLRADQGFMALLAGNTAGGIIARRALPVAVGGPVLAGAFAVAGVQMGLFSDRFGLTAVVIAISTLAAVLVWLLARQLRAVDLRRSSAEEVLASVRRAEAARDRALEDLKLANQDLENFAAIAAHDLRSPLVSVRGFAELLSEHPEIVADPAAAKMVERILSSTRRGTDLVDDLLAFARAGSAKSKRDLVDLRALVERIGAEQEQVAGVAPGTVRTGRLPSVIVDESQFAQVFQNLVGNALRYLCPDREPEVLVDAVSGHDEVVIRVSDNGMGVPEEEREALFTMFVRGSRTTSIAGSGVGLAICHRVVERHFGRIWVEDNEGGGSRFCIGLPRVLEADFLTG